MREASFTPPLTRDDPIEEQLVAADDGVGARAGTAAGSIRDACEPLVNSAAMDGRIALIERGGCEFQVKIANAEDAGAIAVVVYDNTGPPSVMNGDMGSVSIPAVMIGNEDGQSARRSPRRRRGRRRRRNRRRDRHGSARARHLRLGAGPSNVVADFSSRGPSLSDANFVKPDVTAPGVDILAGQTPDVANGLRGETYQYMSGTSQAAPEVTGRRGAAEGSASRRGRRARSSRR